MDYIRIQTGIIVCQKQNHAVIIRNLDIEAYFWYNKKIYKSEFVCMEYVTMEIKKAEIKDLNIVVKLKIDMFKEVGSIVLLQDNAEEQIYEKYKELYIKKKKVVIIWCMKMIVLLRVVVQ